MHVRTAIVEDVTDIQRVATASWHAAHDPIAGSEAVDAFLDEYYAADRLERHVADDSMEVVVAESGGSVVGFAMTGPVEDEPGVFALGSIYVHPDRWGSGFGTRLLERVEQVAADRNAKRLRLAVMVENEQAVGFYESRGFERVDAGYDDRLDVERYFYAKDL